ncbi:nickel/cobalt transporter [Limisalsivibrio acetivorans]|uniref:nickel/cobalt transporter n=1 Tax=Limisalsivibrio acetivorans TaxID=1304888 RepID=UPI0003B340A7|nr:hypothetical protein [Limisalsivibrio acetivorans]
MKNIITLVLLALLIGICTPSSASANPFGAPPDKKEQSKPANDGFQLKDFIISKQLILKQKITALTREIKQKDYSNLWWLFAMAFMYGILHSAGPGHGKTLVASYLISKGGTRLSGIVLGAATAFFHGVSAIIIVSAIYMLSLGRLTYRFSETGEALQWVSYVMITLIGLLIIFRSVKRTGHCCSAESEKGRERPLWVIIALGIVPCPATMIILIFFISMQMPLLGAILAVTVALGMALTVAFVGGLTIVMREYLLERIGKNPDTHSRFAGYAETVGGVLVTLFGAALLYTMV